MRNGARFVARKNADIARILLIWGRKVYCPNGPDVGSGSRVIDIGAHIGTFSISLRRLEIMIAKFTRTLEPNSDNFRRLKDNISGSRCINITVQQAAVSSQTGTTHLYLNPLNSGGHSIHKESLSTEFLTSTEVKSS